MAIKVMVVDDSAVVRQVLQEVFSRSAGIEIMDMAPDPIAAREKMQKQWPDVLLLDIEMPHMDGLTFLKQIMQSRPTPVVICSSLTQKGTHTSMQALAYGAVEVIAKPSGGIKMFLESNGNLLIQAVRAAAQARMDRVRTTPMEVRPKLTADAILAAPSGNKIFQTTERVAVLGASTGGTQALEQVLTALPRTCPGVVIVQHMPERFTASFAERLDKLSQIAVKEAANGDPVKPGQALIAPGGKHMLIKRGGASYFVEVVDGPLVSRHKPSVDVLFRSAAQFVGKNAVGILMTGMGDDGAKGMKEMHDAGAYTVAQDEESCVVFGMPKEAIKLGGVKEVLPLNQIARVICR